MSKFKQNIVSPYANHVIKANGLEGLSKESAINRLVEF
jgi:hypothetical protein